MAYLRQQCNEADLLYASIKPSEDLIFCRIRAVDGAKQPLFLIHETGGRFSWSFGGDFGFLAMNTVVDIAGALELEI
ncbi:hypothetical protein YC2023_073416 [Brassica napus]